MRVHRMCARAPHACLSRLCASVDCVHHFTCMSTHMHMHMHMLMHMHMHMLMHMHMCEQKLLAFHSLA